MFSLVNEGKSARSIFINLFRQEHERSKISPSQLQPFSGGLLTYEAFLVS